MKNAIHEKCTLMHSIFSVNTLGPAASKQGPQNAMTASESFSKRLRDLRGKLSAKDLAERSGVALSAIYNAESEKPVSWKTVEKAYGPLCPGREQLVHLLTLWSLTQTSTPIGLYEAAGMMKTVVQEESGKVSREDAEMIEEMQSMTLPERRNLIRFAKHYKANTATQKMVMAWMESMESGD